MAARTYNNLFAEKLMARVADETERVREELAGGEAIKTFELYRERVGYLRALRDLEEWCTETASDLDKG